MVKSDLVKFDVENVNVEPMELRQIRSLDDHNLMMFLSEVAGYGWSTARIALPLYVKEVERWKQD